MLEQIPRLSPNVTAIKAIGTVTKADYQEVVEPILDQARHENRRIRLLYQFGPEFDRFTGGGVWEDVRIGLSALRLLDACAIVTDVEWIRQSVDITRFMVPFPVRVFENSQLDAAAAWLESLPRSDNLSHRLLADRGVLVVEPKGPLRAQDFDELALMVDPWIEAHGKLDGLVVHAREFPGWENLGSFLRHLRFVRDHHRHIERVAVAAAADSKFADLAAPIADHFIHAEYRHFEHGDIDDAIAWAAGERSPS
ncbi:STAS/SEC14 domain-containing protein [Enhygromyxa salina]|uniref:STAS/SEC14 domain-containing protein n=1 Tax=Enhygromyxa salina TaxID=215803 RepID=A0A2S9YFY0_9BACT|nr:STAS/SEC14 domain-containing protein [Enhygromyxa salina]PRQ03951.1 hypothetical protein ENSA7_51480 [Enhygromyxa salina]